MTAPSRRAGLAALVAATLVLSACTPSVATPGSAGSSPSTAPGAQLNVVTTTQVLADLARHVAGDRASVTALVPPGADPHDHEPTLRDVRDVVYADVAFTNYLLLEQQSIITTLDANLRDGVPNVSLAEESVKYSAELIPLVENVALDTVWLGMRVDGSGADLGADRTSRVIVSATGIRGPGDLFAYLTGTFGDVTRYFDSSDGVDAASGFRDDSLTLPPDAHTHLSWAFTAPGHYELDLQARLAVTPGEPTVPIAEATLAIAVGVDPHSFPGRSGARVIDSGHSDIAVDLDTGEITLAADHVHGSGATHSETFPLDGVVIDVPGRAALEVPPDPAYRFLGRSGDLIHQLPQAVLGRHVHGEIDPHLWLDVGNAMAYVEIIRDTLIAADPRGAPVYRDNATAYLRELDALDRYVRETIAEIPRARRTLVTTHDAFAYLARAYDLTVAGFVTPNPATEPSIAERKRLTQTIRSLEVPAVFLEPALAARSSTLAEVAADTGIAVCPIYSDALDADVATYADLMRFNADSLRRCLAPTPP